MNSKRIVFVGLLILSQVLSCGRRQEDDEESAPAVDVKEKTKGPGASEEATAEEQNAGTFKGYVAFNRELGERLFLNSEDLNLGSYLASQDLVQLLGAFVGQGSKSELINVTPNTMNTLLWVTVIDAFATDVSKLCEHDADSVSFKVNQLRPEIRKTIDGLCKAESANDQLATMWRQWTLYDSTKEEFDMWRAYAQQGIFPQKTGAKAVHDLVYSLLFNPHTLIKK